MDVTNIIKEYLEQLYDGVYINQSGKDTKKLAETLLIDSYYTYCNRYDSSTALAKVIEKYSSLTVIYDTLGIDITNYQRLPDSMIKKQLRKLRCFSLCSSFFIVFTLLLVIGILGRFTILRATLLCVSSIGLFFTLRKKGDYCLSNSYVLEAKTVSYLHRIIDSSKRNILLVIICAISCLFIACGATFTILRFSNIYFLDGFYAITSGPMLWSLAFFLYNYSNFKVLSPLSTIESKKQYQKFQIKTVLVSILLHTLGLLIGFVAMKQGYTDFLLMPNICIFIYLHLWNFIKRKSQLAHLKKIGRVKKAILTTLSILLVISQIMHFESWVLEPYINTIPTLNTDLSAISYDADTGIYSMQMKEEEFKILQITDMHLGGSLISYNKDQKALEAVYELILYTQPDLVIITGDFVFPVGIFSFSFNNYTPIMQFCSFMRNIGIPWTFVYGNHDTESMASHTAKDLDDLFTKYSYVNSKSNLLYPDIQPSITGRHNQIVKINNSDGSLNQVLYLLDSNAYTGEGFNTYDNIHQDQIDWYQDSVESISAEYGFPPKSLLFFHIPIEEYQEAYDLYKQGSDEVTYYFGEVGEKNETISTARYENNLFETIVALQSTQGIFVGHDHYNNISLEYQDVRLTYGMSIDYLAMPGIYNDVKQRGATLITLQKDASFTATQIPLHEIVN